MSAPDRALEVKAAIAAFFAFLSALLGRTGIAVVIMIACIALDYVTGTWAARAHGEWSSEKARQGLWHKLGEFIALGVAMLCDVGVREVFISSGITISEKLYSGHWITMIVCAWYIITELGSILENAAKLGAPIPAALIQGLGRLKKKVDQQELVPNEAENPEAAAPSLPVPESDTEDDAGIDA